MTFNMSAKTAVATCRATTHRHKKHTYTLWQCACEAETPRHNKLHDMLVTGRPARVSIAKYFLGLSLEIAQKNNVVTARTRREAREGWMEGLRGARGATETDGARGTHRSAAAVHRDF